MLLAIDAFMAQKSTFNRVRTVSLNPMRSSRHEIREPYDSGNSLGAPPATDEDSLHESLSSLTLGSAVSRPRRRASVSTSGYRKHWRRSETDTAEPTRGYFSGYRRRGANSSHSLFGSSLSNSNDPQSLPSLRVIASELFLISSLYCRYAIHSLRKPFRRFKRGLFLVIFSVLTIVVILVAWLIVNFYLDSVRVCKPGTDARFVADRPLVEYYVHGRGIGHYARSVAIVEQLNKAGVDVRMFLTRAAMWRALHEDSKTIDIGSGGENMGTTTAISVSSLSPKYSFFETISHTMERIIGDCEVSAQSNRYPQLIISDGDFPGMIRAAVGGIPSVGIAHGQLFHIAQKPSWITSSSQLNHAWNDQGRLNGISSFFSEWQIATHFCFLESKIKTGVVARAPLRPEVLQMAASRKLARKGGQYSALPQYNRIQSLLAEDSARRASLFRKSNITMNGTGESTRRKLVICYFRDHNGEMVVQSLLDAGFDVLLFDNGYYKDMQRDPTRYGVKWIVTDREEQRRRQRLDYRNEVHKSSVYDIGVDQAHEARSRMVGSIEKGDTNSPRLIRVMDRSLFVPLMHVADGVASSAGSQLMSECIYADMPLLALYLEGDEEQRLNVELSRHAGPCHRPKVCGTSFENLAAALKTTNITSSISSPNLVELRRFVAEVRDSNVSETFYRHQGSIGEVSSAPDLEMSSFASEDPFQGLPDAGAIILEIIKQVVNED